LLLLLAIAPLGLQIADGCTYSQEQVWTFSFFPGVVGQGAIAFPLVKDWLYF
jgi:hypothetical protein